MDGGREKESETETGRQRNGKIQTRELPPDHPGDIEKGRTQSSIQTDRSDRHIAVVAVLLSDVFFSGLKYHPFELVAKWHQFFYSKYICTSQA